MPLVPNFLLLKVQLNNLEVVKYPEVLESRNYGGKIDIPASRKQHEREETVNLPN